MIQSDGEAALRETDDVVDKPGMRVAIIPLFSQMFLASHLEKWGNN